MPYRLDIQDCPRADVVVARLSGYGCLKGRRLVEDFAAECGMSGWSSVILDLSHLGGITEETAAALARFRRHCDDRGGELLIVAPNVAVHWVLSREFGEEPAALPDVGAALSALGIEMTAEPVADTVDIACPRPTPGPVAAESLPTRGLAATVIDALHQHDAPEQWLEVLSAALAGAGLASQTILCRRCDDLLHVVGRHEYAFPADGRLGDALVAARVLLPAQELSPDGLMNQEKAFLLWSAAELHLPLIHGGRLVGLLSCATGRGRGLYGLRSSEALALECLGLALAERLAGLCGPAEAPPAAAVEDLVLCTTI